MRSGAWIPVVLGLLVGACTTPSTTSAEEASTVGTEWQERPNEHAEHFKVLSRGAERRILVFGPAGTSDTIGDHRLWTGPAETSSNEHLPGILGRVALSSTTQVPFLRALGALDAVVAVAHADQVRDTTLMARLAAGTVVDITGGDGVDRERLIQLRPDALFGYPSGTPNGVTVPGTRVIEVVEYLEKHPLGRAEWLRVFGVLLGREATADSVFARVSETYRSARSRTSVNGDRPLVFFGSTWQGQWFAPAGNSYMARLITDAGGRYAFGDRHSGGNLTVDAEMVLAAAKQARFWGTVLASPGPVTAADVAGHDRRVMASPAFREQGVFVGNSMEADIFGEAVLRPDEVLLDLQGIFHPALRGGRTPVYFRPVVQ